MCERILKVLMKMVIVFFERLPNNFWLMIAGELESWRADELAVLPLVVFLASGTRSGRSFARKMVAKRLRLMGE